MRVPAGSGELGPDLFRAVLTLLGQVGEHRSEPLPACGGEEVDVGGERVVGGEHRGIFTDQHSARQGCFETSLGALCAARQ